MRLEPFRQKRKAVLHAERQKRKMELPAIRGKLRWPVRLK